MTPKTKAENSDRIFRKAGENYSEQTVRERQAWIEKKLKIEIPNISKNTLKGEKLTGNIENLIGAAQVPIGIAGPVLIYGENARGEHYVPLATTEGALVDSYNRGMLAISYSGGAKVKVLKDFMHITPVFIMNGLEDCLKLAQWVDSNFESLKKIAEKSTQHGKLLRIEPVFMGKRLLLKFVYHTRDAMGLNMINIATQNVCEHIITEKRAERFFLRCNYSADKKSSYANFINGYGKEVLVEATIPKKVVSRVLKSTPEKMRELWITSVMAGMKSGIMGASAHIANGLAALFIATGQDVAQIANCSAGLLNYEVTGDGDLYASLLIPNLTIGTVGGGTGLPTQRECLEILGCHGKGGALKFAEIVAATLLAGELSIMAALTNDDFVKIHELKNTVTKAHLQNQS